MIAKLLVKQILEKPLSYKWTLQGLGMFRLYLSKEVRLHLWDTNHAFPGASTIHTHPWAFTSHIVAGLVTDVVYQKVEPRRDGTADGDPYMTQRIKCGKGGGLVGVPRKVFLRIDSTEAHNEGDSYSLCPDNIHESNPARGTITVVDRRFGSDTEHADVFWRPGREWGSAEPRDATADEISAAAAYSLGRWF